MVQASFQLKKVFDCQAMPEDLRSLFFEHERKGLGRGNDVYIDWYINDSTDKLIDAWLLAQGAEPDEHVLIRHWW